MKNKPKSSRGKGIKEIKYTRICKDCGGQFSEFDNDSILVENIDFCYCPRLKHFKKDGERILIKNSNKIIIK